MVLTGRSSYFHQSRNLKLALLLLTKGANPNLRIPNHDMETASEAPVELLLRYYTRLTDVFGLPGAGCRSSYRPGDFEETELLDTVGLQGELGGLGPGQVTAQARQLLLACLDHGGDPNLPTTDAAKSIYHLALTAPRPDVALIDRMLELGANVNLADVHNTTPLMDVIALGDEPRARRELGRLRASGREILVDNQNCSLQSAVWRAMHQGMAGLVGDLVGEEGRGGTGARVEALPRHAASARLPRPGAIRCGVPPLLAPYLADSPVTANLHARLPRRRHGRATVHEYSAGAMEHVTRCLVAPAVDRGWLQEPGVTERLVELVRQHTAHTAAADPGVVDPAALLPLMFGQLTAGLRQLAVRAVLRQLLFARSSAAALHLLEAVGQRGGFVTASLPVAASGTRLRVAGGEVLRQDYELELGDEVELSFSGVDREGRVVGLVDPRGEQGAVGGSRRTHFEDAPEEEEEVEDMAEILDTLDKLDRELEVVRTDCALQALDRDLASWEGELEATLARITRYQEELRTLQLPGCPAARRREACRAVGAEEARRRSHQLMEELRSQRTILEESEMDLATAERMVEEVERAVEEEEGLDRGVGEQGEMDRVVEELGELEREMASLHMEEELLQARLEEGVAPRRRLDENWSLGSGRVAGEEVVEAGLARVFCREGADAEYSPPTSPPPSQPSPRHSTDRLVRSLHVSVSVRTPPQPPPRISSLPAAASSSSEESWEAVASPGTMASNLAALNTRLFQRRRRVGAAAMAVAESSDTPPPLHGSGEELTSEEEEEVSSSSGSSTDSDTWGGAFSLRNTQSLRSSQQSPPPGDAAVVSRLTARTLAAVTEALGVPDMLRPCFAVEAACLQLAAALAAHQAVACDRNCEGEESDSDSEEDWLASSDAEDSAAGRREVAGDTSADSSSSFSPAGWREPVAASSAASSPGSWLPDREDLRRMRRFLAAQPPPGFDHSTASESED